MNEKKLRIIAASICIIIIIISVIFIKNPLTYSFIKNKKIKIVYLSDYYPSLIIYDPATGLVNIKTLKSIKKRKDVSINQKIFDIFNRLDGSIERDIPYIETDSSKTMPGDIESLIYEWRKKPSDIFKVLYKLSGINTNISLPDRITLMNETIQTKSSKIIFSKADTDTADDAASEKKDMAISVEIINSGSNRNEYTMAIDCLKKSNIDIIDQKNLKGHEKTRVVINTMENYEKAKKIIEILKFDNREIYLEKDYMISDVKIIFGEDYK
jgi:hypothetical protein